MDQKAWDSLRGKLQDQLPPHLFRSLVEPASLRRSPPNSLKLEFSDRFSKESFEEKCLPVLKEVLAQENLAALQVNLDVARQGLKKISDEQYEFSLESINPFDSKYTFDTYVVGSSNQFAHAACIAVSKQPGHCYNPLFIFGGAGLGKTHLLKAIGYHLFQRNKGLRIQFLTSEAFTNDLIQAIREDRMNAFREKYRTGCDVLLLDDVHFLAGKERTQEEFFYTFNFLHEARKQIVITSDRYPKDIQGLENRLQTRFEWGLVADVQPPEIETRIAILQNKAEQSHIKLQDEVAAFIAQHISTNIRELEGSLHRLQAFATLHNLPIDLHTAQQVFKDIAPQKKYEVSSDAILKVVALHFNVTGADLKSPKRDRKFSLPRQICFYLLRKHLLMSFPLIGKFMGGKDHSTVQHGVRKVAESLKNDPEIVTHVTSIESLIR